MNTNLSGDQREISPAQLDHTSGSWGAAFMAGLPHLVMGLLIGIGKLVDTSSLYQSTSALAGIIFMILVTSILVYAWRRGWPLWSASWYLYGAWVSAALASLLISKLNLHESWRYTNSVFFLWVGMGVLGYLFILQKSRLHGLLAIFFLFPFIGIMAVEFVPNPIEGILAICLGILTALAAGLIVRWQDFHLGLGLILSINLLSGLALAYVSEYQATDLLPGGYSGFSPNFAGFLGFLGLYSIISFGAIGLPFLLRSLRKYWKHTRTA